VAAYLAHEVNNLFIVFGVGVTVPLLVEHGNYFTNTDKLALVSRPIFIGERTGWFLEIIWELEEGGQLKKTNLRT